MKFTFRIKTKPCIMFRLMSIKKYCLREKLYSQGQYFFIHLLAVKTNSNHLCYKIAPKIIFSILVVKTGTKAITSKPVCE